MDDPRTLDEALALLAGQLLSLPGSIPGGPAYVQLAHGLHHDPAAIATCERIFRLGGHVGARIKSPFAEELDRQVVSWLNRDAKRKRGGLRKLAEAVHQHDAELNVTDTVISQWRTGARVSPPRALRALLLALDLDAEMTVRLIDLAAQERPNEDRWLVIRYLMSMAVSAPGSLSTVEPSIELQLERWQGLSDVLLAAGA